MICKSWGLFIHFGWSSLRWRCEVLDATDFYGKEGHQVGPLFQAFGLETMESFGNGFHVYIYIYNYYNVCIYRWLYMYTCIEYVIKFTNNLLWVCLKKWERLPKNAYEKLGKWGSRFSDKSHRLMLQNGVGQDMDGPPVISSNVAMENPLRKCGGV